MAGAEGAPQVDLGAEGDPGEGDGEDRLQLMTLVEMFPHLSVHQLHRHCLMFPARTDINFIVDSLMNAVPDDDSPPKTPFQQEEATPPPREATPPPREATPPPRKARPSRSKVAPLAPGKVLRKNVCFVVHRPDVVFRPRRTRRAAGSAPPKPAPRSLLPKPQPPAIATVAPTAEPAVPMEAPALLQVEEGREEEVLAPLLRLAEMFPEATVEALEKLCADHPDHSIDQLADEFLTRQEAQEAADLPDLQFSVADDECYAEFDVQEPVFLEDVIPEEPEDLQMLERYQHLLALLPNADPDFLREKAQLLTEPTLQDFVAEAMESGAYPTLAEYEVRERRRYRKDKYSQRFRAGAFLDAFPDPGAHFDSMKAVDAALGLVFLTRRYQQEAPAALQVALDGSAGNLSRACVELGAGQSCDGKLDEFLDDEPLLQQIAFIEHRAELELILQRRAEAKKRALDKARSKHETLTCGCCYDDELLLNEMAACKDGHLFCKACIVNSAEVRIGEGKSDFPCLTDCTEEFSMKTLKTLLGRATFKRMLQRQQFADVAAADIPGLESCLNCEFSAVADPEDAVFTCLNPECLLVTCRLCKAPGHAPLRCNELPEKELHTKIRIQLEDRMTQALLRECWQCKKKFVKTDGCNKMQCTCGAMMCYLCRQPVKDYSHFNGQGGSETHKCELFSTNEKLHEQAVRDEAMKARAEVAAANPNLELKYDPTLVLP